MNIKSFKPGQEAYTLIEERNRNIETEIKKVTVSGIGKKYVRVVPVGSRYTIEFYDNGHKEFLIEKYCYKDYQKLFLNSKELLRNNF